MDPWASIEEPLEDSPPPVAARAASTRPLADRWRGFLAWARRTTPRLPLKPPLPRLPRVKPVVLGAGLIAVAAVSSVTWALIPSKPLGEQCGTRGRCARDCEKKDAAACVKLAELWRGTAGGPRDLVRVESALSAACDVGDPTSCVRLAWFYEDVASLPAERAGRAPELRRRALNGLEAECPASAYACLAAGSLYATGKGVPRSTAKSLELYARARGPLEQECAGTSDPSRPSAPTPGQLRACLAMAEVHASGMGVPRDQLKSLEFVDRACALGDTPSCVRVGTTFFEGQDAAPGVPAIAKDVARATSAMQKACDRDELTACHVLGLKLREAQRSAEAVAFFRKGCDGDLAASCGLLGRLHFAGEGLPQSTSEAESFYKRELELREAGCARGEGDDCEELSRNYRAGGYGVKISSEKGKEYETKMVRAREAACDAGLWRECEALRVFIEHDPNPDQAKAKGLKERECTLGSDVACRRLGRPPPFPRP